MQIFDAAVELEFTFLSTGKTSTSLTSDETGNPSLVKNDQQMVELSAENQVSRNLYLSLSLPLHIKLLYRAAYKHNH